MSQFRWNWYTSVFTKALNKEVAIADTTYYPASASFIDASPYERIGFLISAGVLDTQLVFQVRQDTSATVTGSVKVVTGATVTVAATDDGTDFFIEVDTSVLDTVNGFKYVTLYATGAAGGNDYAAIEFFGWSARSKPVTQSSTTFPAAHSVSIVTG